MKKLLSFLLVALSFGFVGSSFADIPQKKNQIEIINHTEYAISIFVVEPGAAYPGQVHLFPATSVPANGGKVVAFDPKYADFYSQPEYRLDFRFNSNYSCRPTFEGKVCEYLIDYNAVVMNSLTFQHVFYGNQPVENYTIEIFSKDNYKVTKH